MILLTTRREAAKPHDAIARAVVSVNEKECSAMSGKTDQVKGRIKEAAGVLTDNERLKRKGKVRSGVVGKVKETAKRAVDKIEGRF